MIRAGEGMDPKSGFRLPNSILSITSIAGVLIMLALTAGCGGHSNNVGSASPSASNESTGRDACSLTQYVPNYAASIVLSYWPQFPVHVYFDATSESYTADLQSRAVTAFDGWVTKTGGEVVYSVVSDPSQADITVGFVPVTSALLSSYDADGITYYYPGTSASGSTANQFAGSVKVYVGIDGATERENGTMGHEFGHALGIHGHSPSTADIMYYRWTTARSQTPTARDVNTLDTAYCGIFSRSEPLRGSTPVVRRPMAPPLTDPGWQAIP